MKKISKIISVILFALIPSFVFAFPNNSINFKGVVEISSDLEDNDKTYTSIGDNENAILVTNGNSTLNNIKVDKSGDANDEKADFYGTNAGILVKEGTLNITDGNITTNGKYANAIFAYDKGNINIENAVINTTNNNSGGIMVAGGGKIIANNLKIKTTGDSAAAIRSDRGGGIITVNNGTYETNGIGSPVIYSTADITVDSATLTSTSSEGVVVEGANSVVLNNVNLTDTNNTLNGKSETYKNIFIYQSMSGDAKEGLASFKATNSTITTNNGDTIFVTNTNTDIYLENNKLINNSGVFMRVQTSKWGNAGSNGGNVNLTMKNQEVNGDIIVDDISTLNMSMTDSSLFKGMINNDNSSGKIDLNLSSDSVIILMKDSYINSLNNEDKTNSNIYLNGNNLYVNGEKITANNGNYYEIDTTTIGEDSEKNTINKHIYLVLLSAIAIMIALFLILLKLKEKKES